MSPAPPQDRCALITGGGSGGHVFPGLAVAEELVDRGWRVIWAGSRRGMEARLVKRSGLDFHDLRARPLVGRNAVDRLRALATLAGAAFDGRSLVRREGARVVLGTGGYVSAPAVVGARLAGVPVLLLEPNADPGVANKALSRMAREALVAHEATEGLHCPVTSTGVPVRSEFFDVAEDLPWGSPLRLLVLGGSQGAAQLNRLLPAALARLDEGLGPVVVRHQAGKKHVENAQASYEQQGIHTIRVEGGGYIPEGPRVQVEIVHFLHKVARAMAESHLVISRAGAITLAEICAAGRPSLLVPLTIAGGHQGSNARRLAAAGAAEVFEAGDDGDDQAADRLCERLSQLLGNRRQLVRMAAEARRLGRPRAAADIADRLEARALRAGEKEAA